MSNRFATLPFIFYKQLRSGDSIENCLWLQVNFHLKGRLVLVAKLKNKIFVEVKLFYLHSNIQESIGSCSIEKSFIPSCFEIRLEGFLYIYTYKQHKLIYKHYLASKCAPSPLLLGRLKSPTRFSKRRA